MASKVVDQEQAAVGLHLVRGFIHLGIRIEDQFNLLQNQLTANHHHRPATQQPAPIIAFRWRLARGLKAIQLIRSQGSALGTFGNLVVERIEHFDHLAIDFDGVRHQYMALQDPRDAFGNGCLAVAGRAVQKQRPRGVGGWADLVHQLFADHQALKCCPDRRLVDHHAADRLLPDRFNIRLERHGRWSGILGTV